ncbi:MAG: PIN domain-containing protein [Clostridiaceae bacterium]|nr:PIN domain-containing protein [Clostridiaceae bacterium]
MLYFVDYENTDEAGLNGIEKLTDADTVFFFHNDKNKLSINAHKKVENAKCIKKYIPKVSVKTQNAIDFQLVTYLGYKIKETDNKQQYRIVSKDTGFDAAVKFWAGYGKNIARIESIGAQSSEALCAAVKKLISEKNIDFTVNPDEITKMILKYKTKQGLNNALMKNYKSEQVGQIMSAIKTLIKDKKGA